MQIPNWLFVLSIGALSIAALGLFAWLSASIIQDYVSIKRRRQFEEDLQLAIKHSQPSWDQLADIASTRNVKNATVFWMLQKTMREILTGRNTDLVAHKPVIEGYLSKLKEIEPFEGMPNEIRIHLERIKEQLTQSPDLLQPLTSQIKELLSINEKDKRQQKYYSIAGFFVGFIGLIFAGIAYFYPIRTLLRLLLLKAP
jgi:hypothetical protein